MATNHTTNYQLNLWEPTDRFLRTEFNENSTKIDAAIKAEADTRTALAQTVAGKADASAVTALAQSVAGAMVVGSYQQTPDTQVDISLGFRPRMVILIRCGRPALGIMLGERLTFAFNDFNSGVSSRLSSFTDDGFYIRADDTAFNKNYNQDPATVVYAAFR